MKRLSLFTAAVLVVALGVGVAAFAGGGMGPMGRSGSIARPAFRGFYDGHKDTFVNTDVSDKTQAAEMHINYSPILKQVPMKATSEIYLVQGRTAVGQIPVFGSEPGESSYTPLWHEVLVRWKAGVTPSLLVKDDQIESLASKGELTMRHTGVVLNCPIVKPTKPTISAAS